MADRGPFACGAARRCRPTPPPRRSAVVQTAPLGEWVARLILELELRQALDRFLRRAGKCDCLPVRADVESVLGDGDQMPAEAEAAQCLRAFSWGSSIVGGHGVR